MTILELTLQKLSSAASQFLCASQVSLGALNWSSPRMHSLKKKTLLRTKKNSLSDYSSSFKIAEKAKRNITLSQKSIFSPKKSIWFQAFLDICCCLLICGQKWSFGTVWTRKGEKRCLLHIEGEKMKIDTWTAFGIWLQQTFSFLLFLQQWRGGLFLLRRSSSLRIFYLVEAAEAVAGLINKKEKKKNVGYSDMYWNSFGNS